MSKDTLSRWNVSPFEEAVNNRSFNYFTEKKNMPNFRNLIPFLNITDKVQ